MSAAQLYDLLVSAVNQHAAIRRIRRLQPAGGKGDKLFPPTYPGARPSDAARHVFEHRRIDGRNVLCVLIDSVQSQANRLEEALKSAREARELQFPAIAVDFSKSAVADIGRITTLDAPHRVFDAIIRDSELDGKRFKDSDPGKRLIAAKTQDASAIYELSPTALVFGAWNSTGEGGGMGAKFPRVVVSEIIGIDVATDAQDNPSGKRTGSRVDPLGIRSGVHVFKLPNGDWTLEPPKAGKEKKDAKSGAKEVKPSEVNHSNIAPSVDALGVSVEYAHHVFVLSLAALRRLKFGKPAADAAARATLAALGLASAVALDRHGYFLRSRCDLVPEPGTSEGFELVHANGSVDALNVSSADAFGLVNHAAEKAADAGVSWRKEDLVLSPQQKLVELVRLSRGRALEGASGEDEEG